MSISVAMAKQGRQAERKSRRRSADETDPGLRMVDNQDDQAMPAPDDASLAPRDDLLDYRALRLGARESDERGRLQRAGRGELLALATSTRITVEIDHLLVTATDIARDAIAPPPAGCTPPRAGRYAHTYPGELATSIPADGAWHAVPLSMRETAAEVVHIVVPRESRDAFRMAEIANPFSAPLLDGPAEVYADDRLLLATPLRETAPGGWLALGLGVEPALAVARNVTFSEESAGLLGGALDLVHDVRIALCNKSQRPLAIEVRERLPVAGHGVDDCKVRPRTITPPWEAFTPPDQAGAVGLHRWRLTLAAGEERELRALWAVTIPAKNEVVGGNRREG